MSKNIILKEFLETITINQINEKGELNNNLNSVEYLIDENNKKSLIVNCHRDENYIKKRLILIKKIYKKRKIKTNNEILLIDNIIKKWESNVILSIGSTLKDKKNVKLSSLIVDFGCLYDDLKEHIFKSLEYFLNKNGTYLKNIKFTPKNSINIQDVIILSKTNKYIKYVEKNDLNFENKARKELKNFMSVLFSFSTTPISDMQMNKKSYSLYDSKGFEFNYELKKEDELISEFEPDFNSNYISTVEENEIKEWYKKYNLLNQVNKNKVKYFGAKLNDALMSPIEDRFDNVSKAFDAVFGKMGCVRRSIENGIIEIMKEHNYLYSIEKFEKRYLHFWKVRNLLTHGEMIYSSDYKDYITYYFKYEKKLEDDYIDLAFFCLKHIPHYLLNEEKNY